MDRSDYYRILGVQPGASRAQIDRAYNERAKRLRSPDFADEREYADRKLRELKYAYSVAAGGASPVSERQKLAHHERKKDDMEIAETADSFLGNLSGQMKAAAERFKQSAGTAARHPEGSHSHRGDRAGSDRRDMRQEQDSRKSRSAGSGQRLVNDAEGARKSGQPLIKSFDVSADDGKTLKTIVGIIVVLLALVPSLISSCESSRYPDFDNDLSYNGVSSYESTIQMVDQLLYDKVSDYDYDGWLDDSDAEAYSDRIVYDLVPQEDEEARGYTDELAMHLGLDSPSDALAYLTGFDDYYWDHADEECAALLAEQLMDAPDFYAVAGAVSLYSGERILTMADYLQFLVDVANSQTFSVLYG